MVSSAFQGPKNRRRLLMQLKYQHEGTNMQQLEQPMQEQISKQELHGAQQGCVNKVPQMQNRRALSK